MIEVFPKIFLCKGFCNSYYINDKIRVLIDAGSDFKKPVDLLIITHLHPDHIFYASKIQKRTGCKICIGEGDNDLEGLFSRASIWQGKKIEKFRIGRVLFGNEKISSGEYELAVLKTPGHTFGSICLYDKKEGLLFSGDTIFENGGIGRTDFFNSSKESMKKTLSMLKNLKIKHLFPGHDY
jgi:glyoxylase-like metal-dependent hydrolase (beta-lactamase superfamily II)